LSDTTYFNQLNLSRLATTLAKYCDSKGFDIKPHDVTFKIRPHVNPMASSFVIAADSNKLSAVFIGFGSTFQKAQESFFEDVDSHKPKPTKEALEEILGIKEHYHV
jgi:hypothetical protein